MQIDGAPVSGDPQVPIEHLQQRGYGGGVLGQDLPGVEGEQHDSCTLSLENRPGDGRVRLDLNQARDVRQVVHPRLRGGPGQSVFGHDVASFDGRSGGGHDCSFYCKYSKNESYSTVQSPRHVRRPRCRSIPTSPPPRRLHPTSSTSGAWRTAGATTSSSPSSTSSGRAAPSSSSTTTI